MPFEKGYKPEGGSRKKGGKNKQRLIRYTPKEWKKTMHSYYDVDEVNFRLENNLPLGDYIDTLNSKYRRRKNDEEV
jgi:hypothetical protein